MAKQVRFEGVVEAAGKTATGIEVPPEAVTALESGKRPAVRVTLNGHSYRSTVGVMGGRSMLPVSAQVRQQSGVSAGDAVFVELQLDTEERTVVVPDDLAAALAADPMAQAFFAGLSYSNRQRHVLAIDDAKTPATRQRRIDKAVALFREGRS